MGNSSDKMILLGDKLAEKQKLVERLHFTVYEDKKDKQYEYWLQKSEVNNFSAQEAFLNDLINIPDQGIVRVRNVMRGQIKEWFTNQYLFAALIDHPKYSLLEFLQRKQQQLRVDQIFSMTLQLIGAQVLLDKNSIFLGLNNIYTNDEQGNIWMLKPIRAGGVKIVTRRDEKIDEDSQIIGFPPPDFKPEREDDERTKIFSFGMILLQLLSNQSNSDIYDEKQQFKQNIFQERLDKVINSTLLKFQEFTNFLKDMLNLDKNKEITFKILSKQILTFQSGIPPKELQRLTNLLNSRNNKESIQVSYQNAFSVPLAEQDCIIKFVNQQKSGKEQAPAQQPVQVHEQVPQKMLDSPQFCQQVIEEVYSGQLFENKYNGKGKLIRKFSIESTDVTINPDDLSQASQLIQIYEGEFSLQKKHGRGKITYLNGDTFEGQFENDNINGEGLFKSKYIIKQGIWKNNKLEKSTSSICNLDQLYSFQQPKKIDQKQVKIPQQISESSTKNNPYQKLIKASPNSQCNQVETPTKQDNQNNNAFEISQFPYSIVESEIKQDHNNVSSKQIKEDDKTSIQPKQIINFYQSPQYQDAKIIYNGRLDEQQIGQGKLFNSKDQLIYEGQFRNGFIDKQGILYNLQAFQINQVDYEDLNKAINLNQWVEYFGSFNNGKKHGSGRLKFTDKSEFFGQFVNDQITGQGEFTTSKNQKIRGNWIDGKFVQSKTY